MNKQKGGKEQLKMRIHPPRPDCHPILEQADGETTRASSG